MAPLDLGGSHPVPGVPRHLTPGDLTRGAILHAHRSAAYMQSAAPLADDLEAAGFRPERLGDLSWRGVGGHQAIPVLLRWLPRIANDDVKVDIIAALASPWARPGVLVTLFAVLGLARADARQEMPALLTTAGHPNPIVRAVLRQTVRRWSAPEA